MKLTTQALCVLLGTFTGPAHTIAHQEGELDVRDQPRVVSGVLEPIAPGSRSHAEGLLIGLTSGATFQYRLDDVRLLCVRQGAFASRGREGRFTPLGQVRFLCKGGSPEATFKLSDPDSVRELRSDIVDAWIRHTPRPVRRTEAGLSYSLSRGRSQVATVEETVRSLQTPSGWGFVRRFEIGASERMQLQFSLAPGGERVGTGVIVSGPPSPDDWSLRAGGRSMGAAYEVNGDLHCVRWSRPGGVSEHNEVLEIELQGEPIRFEVAFVVTSEWSRDVDMGIIDALSAD